MQEARLRALREQAEKDGKGAIRPVTLRRFG